MRGVMLWDAVALVGVGCANARYVQRDMNGGVVAMSSNTDGNREKALKLIADHVGPDYRSSRSGKSSPSNRPPTTRTPRSS